MCPENSHKTLSILHKLSDVIIERKKDLPKNSYTTTLFEGGVTKISEKILEESNEFVEAAFSLKNSKHFVCEEQQNCSSNLCHEAADLLYHVLVLLVECGLTLEDVENELAKRFGKSGLEEKTSRQH